MLRDIEPEDDEAVDGDFREAQIIEASTVGCKTGLHNVVGGPCVICPRWYRQLNGGRAMALVAWNTKRAGRSYGDDVYDAIVATRFASLDAHLSWKWSDVCFNYEYSCPYRTKHLEDHETMLYSTQVGAFENLLGWREWFETPYRPTKHFVHTGEYHQYDCQN